LGVVGIVVPWNFPIFLGLSPLVYALAAGNNVMLKMSEFAPETGTLMAQILGDIFPRECVCAVNGGVETATRFTQLPFDHLVFTGSTRVGKMVMRSAADNLTPVTLELGGKSPVIIHPDYSPREAAKRIAFGKCINAGQVCVSPDYVLCHKDHIDEFCEEFVGAVSESYPTLIDNTDYTAIISDHQKQRLSSYVADARQKGARVWEINPAGENFEFGRKMPMTLLTDVKDEMRVMQEEIFGPILPVLPYDHLDDALAYVNERDRPLALYYFDWNKQRARDVLHKTHSGGACINDTMSHVMADDLPFGGVGPSGMGQYHGREGFEAFSNMRGVVRKGRVNFSAIVGAPWDRLPFKLVMAAQWMKYRKRRVTGLA
jgi:coniferyl-aldehyde dehydrogenase